MFIRRQLYSTKPKPGQLNCAINKELPHTWKLIEIKRRFLRPSFEIEDADVVPEYACGTDTARRIRYTTMSRQVSPQYNYSEIYGDNEVIVNKDVMLSGFLPQHVEPIATVATTATEERASTSPHSLSGFESWEFPSQQDPFGAIQDEQHVPDFTSGEGSSSSSSSQNYEQGPSSSSSSMESHVYQPVKTEMPNFELGVYENQNQPTDQRKKKGNRNQLGKIVKEKRPQHAIAPQPSSSSRIENPADISLHSIPMSTHMPDLSLAFSHVNVEDNSGESYDNLLGSVDVSQFREISQDLEVAAAARRVAEPVQQRRVRRRNEEERYQERPYQEHTVGSYQHRHQQNRRQRLAELQLQHQHDELEQQIQQAQQHIQETNLRVNGADYGEEGDETVWPKPTWSYSTLIALAMRNSDTGSLTVAEIYHFMLYHFPYFRKAPGGWKNSVRHNLSLNKCFQKDPLFLQPDIVRKSCLWQMVPYKDDKVNADIRKCRERGTVEGLAYPEQELAMERGEIGFPPFEAKQVKKNVNRAIAAAVQATRQQASNVAGPSRPRPVVQRQRQRQRVNVVAGPSTSRQQQPLQHQQHHQQQQTRYYMAGPSTSRQQNFGQRQQVLPKQTPPPSRSITPMSELPWNVAHSLMPEENPQEFGQMYNGSNQLPGNIDLENVENNPLSPYHYM